MLYIFSVMSGNYEIITGWLLLKAFFGWIESEKQKDADEQLLKYNAFIIGTILSLLIGIAVGLAAKFVLMLLTGRIEPTA